MKRTLLTLCLDLALLAIAFAAVHWLNYGDLRVSESNRDVWKLQVVVWLVVSVGAGKFTRVFPMNFVRGTGLLLKAGVAALFLMSLMIVGMQWMHFSRTMAYGTGISLVLLEVFALGVYQRFRGPAAPAQSSSGQGGFWEVARPLMILDGMLLGGAFLWGTFLKRGGFGLSKPYDDILLILMGLWLGGSLITRKFNRDNFHDFFVAMGPAVKTVLTMAAGLAFFIYVLRMEPVSRFQAFGPLLLFLAMESVVFWLYVNYREHGRANGDIEDPVKVREMLGSEKHGPPLEPGPVCPVTDPAGEKLKHALDFFDHRIYEMLSANVDLGAVDRRNCSLVSTDNMFNLDVMANGRMQLIINLHKLNDIRWFNRYFLLAHQKLMPGGCLVGKAHTITTHRRHYKEKYSRYMNLLYYGLSFVWGRMFPKLPWLKQFYFAVTGGKGRMVSRAEILGRLCFCGFEIVAEKELGTRFFFIAKKVRAPSTAANPTYGPLVHLTRSGLGGKPITVYKFRTMYPFSEYLQDYVYRLNHLDNGGKFKDDFRVTGWGRFMRRTWLDELPMLYNWLRGDLQLIGVRPLSSQYLELYDEDLKELRKRVKPGLLPPFYADMPETLEEIMESERRYIRTYLRRPVKTQLCYFGRCVWNIGVQHKRSA